MVVVIFPLIVGLLINMSHAQRVTPMREMPIAVYVTPTVCLAPCNTRIEVVIPPKLENRLARLVVDGSMYFSSEIELNGANARKRYTFSYHDLTAGTYIISATLWDSSHITSRSVVRLLVSGG